MGKKNKLRKRQGDPYDEDTGTSDEERGKFSLIFEKKNLILIEK